MEGVNSLLNSWTLGIDGVDLCVESHNQLLPDTSVSTDDPWWAAIASVLDKRCASLVTIESRARSLTIVFLVRGLSYDVSTFPGATGTSCAGPTGATGGAYYGSHLVDSRFIREMGIPAIGVSPFRNTPVLLHDHDEHLGCSEYLEGVSIYEDLVQALSS